MCLCLPAALLLVCLALAIFGVGAGVLLSGAFVVSLSFLGVAIFADVILLCGAGLMLAAVGILIVFFAVWFFVGAVIGFVNTVLRVGSRWCRKEADEQ